MCGTRRWRYTCRPEVLLTWTNTNRDDNEGPTRLPHRIEMSQMQLAVEGTRAVPKVLLTLTHTNRDDKDIVMMSPRVHLTRNKSMVVCLLEVSEAELYTLTSVIISDAVSIYRFYERYFFYIMIKIFFINQIRIDNNNWFCLLDWILIWTRSDRFKIN